MSKDDSLVLLAWLIFAIGMGWVAVALWRGSRRRAPTIALKSKADRGNPMTAGCEMDAPTLGLPVEAETGRGRFQ